MPDTEKEPKKAEKTNEKKDLENYGITHITDKVIVGIRDNHGQIRYFWAKRPEPGFRYEIVEFIDAVGHRVRYVKSIKIEVEK
jgi:hypothetical protein